MAENPEEVLPQHGGTARLRVKEMAAQITINQQHNQAPTTKSSAAVGLSVDQLAQRENEENFARPGHVFPLCARPGGVLERRGQTEAAIDLASLAGLQPAGVICESDKTDAAQCEIGAGLWAK